MFKFFGAFLDFCTPIHDFCTPTNDELQPTIFAGFFKKPDILEYIFEKSFELFFLLEQK